jgi:glycosyltransferase involved in cell wall biosynthesis
LKKIDILHIYPGTSGSSGLYIHEIFKSLEKHYHQEIIVSYNFPFSYGKKIYYRFTDLAKPNFIHRNNLLRLAIRYFELLYALSYSLIFIFIFKPKIINYSFTTQINLELYFLKIISKFSNSKIWLTAHDVVPFNISYFNFEKTKSQREFYFKLADKIVVHNLNSKNDLCNIYNIEKLKILDHLFPIMNLNQIDSDFKKIYLKKFNLNTKEYFLFTGHLRAEKGVQILIDAWAKYQKNDNLKIKKLVIAGNIPIDFNTDFKENIIFINRFLSDSEYHLLIKNAFCVVLPYTRGTNSGIPSSVVSLNTKLITSDIEMFKNNSLVDKKFIFKSGDSSDLSKLLYKSFFMRYDFSLIDNYKKDFRSEILKVYKKEID